MINRLNKIRSKKVASLKKKGKGKDYIASYIRGWNKLDS